MFNGGAEIYFPLLVFHTSLKLATPRRLEINKKKKKSLISSKIAGKFVKCVELSEKLQQSPENLTIKQNITKYFKILKDEFD